MQERFFSSKNLRFLLYDVHDADSLTRLPHYRDHDRETFDLVLDAAARLAKDLFLPCRVEMDRNQPEYERGTVRVHPAVREILRQGGEGGWISADFPYDHGGQQLPVTVCTATRFIFLAGNYSAAVYAGLTTAAARLITSFGAQELIETYVPKMLSGAWQGTMALTEPQAGSSLSDVKTRAVEDGAGFYRIQGQKIFISAGEHDAADNIIHLALARIPGSPVGVKGISLFLVPKLRFAAGGGLEPNDVHCTGIYHKLGYRGAPITQLSFGEEGDCRGYLVGERNRGLAHMFQMMNEERLEVGMGAAALSSAAYYASLSYALERPQGRPLASKDPSQPQVPIIQHPDVRRMLLFQRAVVEGSLCLILQCAKYADLARSGQDEEKERAAELLDLLTPIAKTYPSEMGILSTSQGLQILGGYGYCDEFPLEQLFRDTRIHPIHEGTTGIQGIDLLGRKVRINQGKAFELFLQRARAAVGEVRGDRALDPYARRLEQALETLEDVTSHLYRVAGGAQEILLADATLYLELFGIVTIAWQWLLQGVSVRRRLAGNPGESDRNFLEGKWRTLQYFFHYELPKVQGLAQRLREADGLTVHMGAEHFED
ncbi:MAG: acyl-CoA dehydrogenase [Deltaproteobacteria bacterium]|nr:acyl-CoA dehydrogenase [Deltaproteobacteria bacterium]